MPRCSKSHERWVKSNCPLPSAACSFTSPITRNATPDRPSPPQKFCSPPARSPEPILAILPRSAILVVREKSFVEVAKNILLIVSALFPIVNPLGGSPIFLALTRDSPAPIRMILARRVAMNSFILLVASFLIGSHILAFFGISIPVVQVGGGLVVISTGWALLSKKDEQERHGQVQKSVNPLDVFRNAFYPLTLPLTVGPGSIAVAITLGANEPRHLGPDVLSIIAAVI